MMLKSEIIEWLQSFKGDVGIAVDDGGLTLIAMADGEEIGGFEIGGIPLDEEDGDTGLFSGTLANARDLSPTEKLVLDHIFPDTTA